VKLAARLPREARRWRRADPRLPAGRRHAANWSVTWPGSSPAPDSDNDPGLTPWLFERVADVAHYRLPWARPRACAPRATVLMRIPGASRRAEHVRPVLDHASCDPPLRADRPRKYAFQICPAGQVSRGGIPHRGRPPIPLIECCRIHPGLAPRRLPCEDGRCSLGALLRNTREQGTNLSLPVAPVSPQRAD
jgi:hypothetical protein